MIREVLVEPQRISSGCRGLCIILLRRRGGNGSVYRRAVCKKKSLKPTACELAAVTVALIGSIVALWH